jgi:8-oxo-dGTP pyrophosphatase MutT (NUDIX family)
VLTDETPREAAIREFKEETGLNVEVIGEQNNLSSDDAIEEPKPIAIMYETVKYPNEIHMHYDLILRTANLASSRGGIKFFKSKILFLFEMPLDAFVWSTLKT